MKEVSIRTEYIELGKFLKLADCISTGGQAKFFLQETVIHINGEADNRRGRKLYAGDKVEVEGQGMFVVTRE
ncbi:S4 domain-containing protein YaaA [Paenibacillus sp. PAMC21692]|uniref:S4 domain-containing protein YaaA n=1 Tax=Paenibacillus sp. PAMC21692 TaxID=2762320 RepID=UPI00164D3793|nr:S4 domain-containing protein YaaA [Paenibacillus sp. PAMC21692]QNK58064.1 S4 domain-containing protein YaaA [Paenibacillus sp. PAMC21692]